MPQACTLISTICELLLQWYAGNKRCFTADTYLVLHAHYTCIIFSGVLPHILLTKGELFPILHFGDLFHCSLDVQRFSCLYCSLHVLLPFHWQHELRHEEVWRLGFLATGIFQDWDILLLLFFKFGTSSYGCFSLLGHLTMVVFQDWDILLWLFFQD